VDDRIADEIVALVEWAGEPVTLCALADKDWAPIVLLPARAANISTKNGLLRVPEEWLTPEHKLPNWKVLGQRH
jgi:hypothetical protein